MPVLIAHLYFSGTRVLQPRETYDIFENIETVKETKYHTGKFSAVKNTADPKSSRFSIKCTMSELVTKMK